MNGAESMLQTLINNGVEVCFTNPGTSEMHMVAAIGKTTGMRSILGLFEGVCTGAADGYGRMAEANLHVRCYISDRVFRMVLRIYTMPRKLIRLF